MATKQERIDGLRVQIVDALWQSIEGLSAIQDMYAELEYVEGSNRHSEDCDINGLRRYLRKLSNKMKEEMETVDTRESSYDGGRATRDVVQRVVNRVNQLEQV